ncbi:NnrS family protein [Paracoccus jeotgali]|uniref:NnrS family protein n=1 Tax=Paracoccus jeotgali TaxID=2065379 RepID=A0A2K9MCD1_9RHOB|nr:NnrS family protein [Paracoccus jeotgali]AUM73299.1 NnrS family protein [Paracoccus jeotgali]
MKSAILFRAGWRVFFWAAGIWAVLSMGVWSIWLAVNAAGGDAGQLGLTMSPQMWHAHEMIFGFATAALGGFFLTAVPNWTGAKAAPEAFIAGVFAIWLAGRIAVALSGVLPPALTALFDLAFLPILGAKLLTQLLRRPKPQNMMFLLLLSLVWLGDLLVHLQWMGLTGTEAQGLRGGLLAICAMIATLGGRVTPAFTRNALLRAGREDRLPVTRGPLEKAGIALPILTSASVLFGLPDLVSGLLAVGAGLATAGRLAGWQGWVLRDQPIVWALHTGYGLLALGFLVWGLSLLGLGSEIGALHILGIGAVGGMTLAVMSRASLGHSGRALIAPRAVAIGYVLVPVAVLLRWLAASFPGFYDLGVLASAVLWIVAFGLYVMALSPVFFSPRADGKAEA